MMKNRKSLEKEYVGSYDKREGCFSVAAATFVIMLIVSIGLNIIQFIKIYQLMHK